MSWSRTLQRAVFAGVMLSVGVTIGACSFSPVYSGTLASQPGLDLAYAKPTNRLEQIVYQELSLRFGTSTAEMAPLATVVITGDASDMVVTTTTNPSKPVEVTVTATLTIMRRDDLETKPTIYVRTASADYTRSGQVLADNAAATEAAERAAKSAAESLRLAVLANLSR